MSERNLVQCHDRIGPERGIPIIVRHLLDETLRGTAFTHVILGASFVSFRELPIPVYLPDCKSTVAMLLKHLLIKPAVLRLDNAICLLEIRFYVHTQAEFNLRVGVFHGLLRVRTKEIDELIGSASVLPFPDCFVAQKRSFILPEDILSVLGNNLPHARFPHLRYCCPGVLFAKFRKRLFVVNIDVGPISKQLRIRHRISVPFPFQVSLFFAFLLPLKDVIGTECRPRPNLVHAVARKRRGINESPLPPRKHIPSADRQSSGLQHQKAILLALWVSPVREGLEMPDFHSVIALFLLLEIDSSDILILKTFGKVILFQSMPLCHILCRHRVRGPPDELTVRILFLIVFRVPGTSGEASVPKLQKTETSVLRHISVLNIMKCVKYQHQIFIIALKHILSSPVIRRRLIAGRPFPHCTTGQFSSQGIMAAFTAHSSMRAPNHSL